MLKPASLFTDGAVLCRGKEIRVFGEADSGTEVSVTLWDRDGKVLASAACQCREGRFLACLSPQKAQTGCRLAIQAGAETAEAEDVAIGEVFLAGGQSNMELELRNAEEGPVMIREYCDPLLRFFNIPKMAVADPEQRKANEETRWHAISPGEGGENSAAAYFFARKLREKMPEVPVGIIGCYWGGTSVTCWMEEKELRTSAEGTRYLEEYARQSAGISMESYLKEEKAFWEAVDSWNRAAAEYQKDHPDASWKEVQEVCGPPVPWLPPAGPGSPFRPGGLAVTMVREAIPVTLTGILYYQGEQDAGMTDRYDALLKQLILSWRKLFRDRDLPFLFVQLPMWLDWGAEDTRSWAKLRLAQARVRDEMPHTGMICLLDQGEYGNIHPTRKRPVGERLAELAGFMLYGGGAVSPRALKKDTEGDTLTVKLSAPVRTRDGKAANLLEIAGKDGRFVPAEAEIRDSMLLLKADGIDCPLHVRYAWTDWSDRVNLFGLNDLPLEPFSL